MAEVQPKIVTILADAAENVEEIDITRAQAAKKRAEDALTNLKPEDHDAYLRMEAALRRSNLRLDVARRYRKTRDVGKDPKACPDCPLGRVEGVSFAINNVFGA
jgi:F-type H+-transporting ATPase subunit epsilon